MVRCIEEVHIFQKEVSKRVFEKLKIICPFVKLAGGAPRDWYLGNPCNDLDFYFCTMASQTGYTRFQLESIFPEASITLLMDKQKGKSDPLYKSMKNLVRIWEMIVDGVPVQLIQMESIDDVSTVEEQMDVSICKISYDPMQDEYHKHLDFKVTDKSKIIFLKEGYDLNCPHAQKIKKRFVDEGRYRLGTKDFAIDCVLRALE